MEYFFDNLYEEKSLLQHFARKIDIKKYLFLSKCKCIYSIRHNRIKFVNGEIELKSGFIDWRLCDIYITIKYNAALKYDKIPIRDTNLIANIQCRGPIGKNNMIYATPTMCVSIVGYDYNINELLQEIDTALQEYHES